MQNIVFSLLFDSQSCWELANQAKFHNISGPMCSSDGSFYARQCDKLQSKCWCVTPNGIYISGFESRLDEDVNCGRCMLLFFEEIKAERIQFFFLFLDDDRLCRRIISSIESSNVWSSFAMFIKWKLCSYSM